MLYVSSISIKLENRKTKQVKKEKAQNYDNVYLWRKNRHDKVSIVLNALFLVLHGTYWVHLIYYNFSAQSTICMFFSMNDQFNIQILFLKRIWRNKHF